MKTLMDTLKVEVVEHPAIRVVGMKIHSSLPNASTECRRLWQQFMPRGIGELFGGCKTTYGVSTMTGGQEFDYWAAVEIDPNLPIPDDMETIVIPHGDYALCMVPKYDLLDDAYDYMFHHWLPRQTNHVYQRQSPCFEHYPSYWQPSDFFELYVPVAAEPTNG